MSPKPGPGAQNLSKIARNTSPNSTEIDTGRAFSLFFFCSLINFSVFKSTLLPIPLSCQILLGMVESNISSVTLSCQILLSNFSSLGLHFDLLEDNVGALFMQRASTLVRVELLGALGHPTHRRAPHSYRLLLGFPMLLGSLRAPASCVCRPYDRIDILDAIDNDEAGTVF